MLITDVICSKFVTDVICYVSVTAVICYESITGMIFFMNDLSPWLAGSKTAEWAERQADRANLHFCVTSKRIPDTQPSVHLYHTLTSAREVRVS